MALGEDCSTYEIMLAGCDGDMARSPVLPLLPGVGVLLRDEQDGRAWVRNPSGGERFDLILSTSA